MTKTDTPKWQPIENAPLDGTRILIPSKDKNGEYRIATVANVGGYDSGSPVWFEAETGLNYYWPSVWMPMPENPDQEKANETV